VKPSTKSISAVALAMESKMTDDFRVSLTNAPGKESYPIVSFTWFYVPVHPQDLQRSHALKEYLSWVYGSGEKIAQAQGYAPLPSSVLRARWVAKQPFVAATGRGSRSTADHVSAAYDVTPKAPSSPRADPSPFAAPDARKKAYTSAPRRAADMKSRRELSQASQIDARRVQHTAIIDMAQ
jgi:hypothetical protein